MEKFEIIVCPIYAKEVESIIQTLEIPDIGMSLLPCACILDADNQSLCDNQIANAGGYDQKNKLWICSNTCSAECSIKGYSCNIPLVSQSLVQFWTDEGFLVVSSGWFKSIIEPDLKRNSLHKMDWMHSDKVIVLDSGVHENIEENIIVWSQISKIEVVNLPVGLEVMTLMIQKSYLDYKTDDLRHKINEKNQILLTEIIKNDRSQQNQEFAKIVHDIRNPLNAISGAIQLLNFTQLSTEQEKLVNIALESIQGFLDQMDRLHTFSAEKVSDQSKSQDWVNLKKIFNEMQELFSERAKARGTELVYHMSEDLKVLYKGDAHRIKQTLFSLLENAFLLFEFAPITVSCHVLDRVSDAVDLLEFRIEISSFERIQDHQIELEKMKENIRSINRGNLEIIDGNLDVYKRPQGGICFRLTCRIEGL